MQDRKKCIDDMLKNYIYDEESREWIFECRESTSNQHYALKLNVASIVNSWREMSLLADKVAGYFESGPCLNCERCG